MKLTDLRKMEAEINEIIRKKKKKEEKENEKERLLRKCCREGWIKEPIFKSGWLRTLIGNRIALCPECEHNLKVKSYLFFYPDYRCPNCDYEYTYYFE